MNKENQNSPPNPSRLEQLEAGDAHLWRVSLLLLALLATALAVVSWERLRELSTGLLNLEAVPLGVLVLVVLYVAHSWMKKRDLDQLRGLVKVMREREQAPPSEQQLEKLTEVLSRSQQGYRELIDSFDDLVFALSLDGEIRAANRRFAETFEQSFSDLVGHRLEEFLDEPKSEAARKALPRFLERRQWSGMVRTHQKKTGTVRYFECVLHPILKMGEVVGVGGIARDVTQLRESETRFSELFETLQEGVYFTTPDGRVLDANPALVRMLGYESKEELLGLSVNDLYFNPADRPALLREVDESARVRAREIILRKKDGKPLICLDTSSAIRDPLGRVVRYQGTLLDITHRREIEKRLHKEQELARRMVECFPDSIVVLDTQGRYTYASPRVKEQLGFSPEELVGQTLGDRTDTEDRKQMLAMFQGLVTGQHTYGTVEYRTRHKDGSWRLFRAAASPLFNEAGEITGVVASARDTTEIKQLEQQVVQSEKLAAMGQMIAGVAHELNNPLTAILGVTDLLREKAADEASHRQLDLAHQQARRAAGIVQNLLAFARPATPKKTKIQLNDVVRRTLQLQEHSLKAERIEADFREAPNLPLVIGDSHQLMQVFVNLFVNATQAIRETREHGRITVRSGSRDNGAWASIQDDGPGIQPDILPRIFDPFFTTKRPGRGTGLGLSICMAIVKEHNGSLEVESTPGFGSLFTLWLPGVKEADFEEEDQASVAAGLAGRSILVVEDEESICAMVRDTLGSKGLEVECVNKGEDALARAAAKNYDLVLCDLTLPDLSGLQVYRRLKKRNDGTRQPFVLMSGNLADSETLSLLQQDDARMIQKPFKLSDLLTTLRETLETVPSGAR